MATQNIGQNSSFPDVTETVRWFNAVMTVTTRGLMKPELSGEFRPAPVTGADLFVGRCDFTECSQCELIIPDVWDLFNQNNGLTMHTYKKTPAGLLLFFMALGMILTPRIGLAFEASVTEDQGKGIFETGYIEVVGESESGQRRYAAIRAATVVAQRNLLEEFKGVRIQGEITIADGMLKNDTVRSHVKGFLRGARICGRTFHAQERYAEVCLRLYLRGRGGVYDSLYKTLQEEKIVGAMEEIPTSPQPNTSPSSIYTVVTDKVDYDGVIIEMAGLPFKPAIVNRILNRKGEILFDPSKVVNSILIERGAGGFTNQLGKAKGLLASWNGMKPLLIQAIETKQGTDTIIGDDDAARMSAANKRNSFLSQAKVVFVIN